MVPVFGEYTRAHHINGFSDEDITSIRIVHDRKGMKYCKSPQSTRPFNQAFIHYLGTRHGIIKKTMEKTGQRSDNVSCLLSQTNL